MIYDIKVEGLDKLIKKLGAATAQATIEGPMYRGALLFQGWSQEHRFVSGGGKSSGKGSVQPNILTSRSGRLRGSITVSRNIQREKFEFFIGTNVNYARIHEFGGLISRLSKRGKSFQANYPARPFLTPSLENKDNVDKVTAMVQKAINEALDKT